MAISIAGLGAKGSWKVCKSTGARSTASSLWHTCIAGLNGFHGAEGLSSQCVWHTSLSMLVVMHGELCGERFWQTCHGMAVKMHDAV